MTKEVTERAWAIDTRQLHLLFYANQTKIILYINCCVCVSVCVCVQTTTPLPLVRYQ